MRLTASSRASDCSCSVPVTAHFTTAVFDLVPIHGDVHHELPKSDPGYYFRPQKTILVRTVADGGESSYFCGHHRATLPALRRAILELA